MEIPLSYSTPDDRIIQTLGKVLMLCGFYSDATVLCWGQRTWPCLVGAQWGFSQWGSSEAEFINDNGQSIYKNRTLTHNLCSHQPGMQPLPQLALRGKDLIKSRHL